MTFLNFFDNVLPLFVSLDDCLLNDLSDDGVVEVGGKTGIVNLAGKGGRGGTSCCW